MSRRARLGIVLAAVVGLVVGFVLVSPGADDDSNTASTPTDAPTVPTLGAPTTTGAGRPTAQLRPRPAFTTIRVRDGRPAGGVKTITVQHGERARIQVTSPDTTDEVHLHGYDISRDLKAGGRVRFSFEADADGIYEIELEGSHTQIGRLVVEP